MVLNDAVLYLIKLTSRFISARKAPSIRPAMKTGTNLTACQGEFLRQFLLGASGFYLYPKEAQNVVLTAMRWLPFSYRAALNVNRTLS